MAARQVGVWGIDVGQCALKAIRLEMKDGQVIATAFEYIEHPKILSQPDADPDELSREALNQFLSRNNIRGDYVCISVPGQSGLARFVKLPPVDEKKIADIVKFEAKQQIPFPLEEVVWDFQRLNRGDIVDGMALETEIGLFAMKRDMVTRSLSQFKGVNIEVQVVQMAPLALCNFVSFDLLGKSTANTAEDNENAHECIVCLEIGTDSSNLVITDGGRIIWQRPIPIGGNHFTRALTKEMKLTFAKAEHLKRNAAKSPDLKKILSALKQVLNDFVGEVQRSLGYFTNTHRTAKIQYMIGLGNAFRLPGLQKFLQEKLQLEVKKFQKLTRTTGESVTAAPTFAENIMSFGVAYGLALQGLKQARLQTNLLPYEVRLERVIRGKKPWVVTAAASLLVGLFILAFARGMEKSSIEDEKNLKGTKAVEDAMKDATDKMAKFTAAENQLKKNIGVLQRIGAGVGERMNWQHLHQYINMATPQPNGDRLVAMSKPLVPVRKKYWDDDITARNAFKGLEAKKFQTTGDIDPKTKGTTVADDFAKKHLENLIQINIAGINALYTDDLSPYYRKLLTDNEQLLGMHEAEKELLRTFVNERDAAKRKLMMNSATTPYLPGDGWLVEIRCYTYHKDKLEFVKDTIIENLKYPDALKTIDGKDLPNAKMVKDFQEKVGFLVIYNIETVKNPVAGQFKIIQKSYLKSLVKGNPDPLEKDAKGGAKGMPAALAAPAGDPAGAIPKQDRESWQAIGETAKAILEGNAAAFVPPPAPVAAKPGEKVELPAPTAPRTEFIVLFVWQEPIMTQRPINLSQQPAAPGTPAPGTPAPANPAAKKS